ncbi:hypothetical protein ANN_27693 [Periplaneta americana]|uniref:THAP-type domain-containing protein n=1 Tax=Periplaneta americana TaxID=6978 RepID=A0ABQ8RUV8_PERAM|nr:hypothetical protein ANN_27693 [Periplaneta americana]
MLILKFAPPQGFQFPCAPSNHVRVSSTNFIQRSSKYNIKNNENSVTAAVSSSEQAPTFRLLSRVGTYLVQRGTASPQQLGNLSSHTMTESSLSNAQLVSIVNSSDSEEFVSEFEDNNKAIEWKLNPPPQQGHLCASNLIKITPGFTSSVSGNVSFFSLPKENTIRNQFTYRRADKFNPNTSKICSRHFKSEDFELDFRAQLLDIPIKRPRIIKSTKKLHYPLPSISSLQRWAATLTMRQGILPNVPVLKLMKMMGQTMTDFEKATVLCYDEMKVDSLYEYDQKHDEVLGPHSYIQVIMARRHFSRWKQPIYLGFDSKMSKSLHSVFKELYEINYNIVACGGGKLGLWAVNYQFPWSAHLTNIHCQPPAWLSWLRCLPAGLKLARAQVRSPFGLITWLGFSEVFPNPKEKILELFETMPTPKLDDSDEYIVARVIKRADTTFSDSDFDIPDVSDSNISSNPEKVSIIPFPQNVRLSQSLIAAPVDLHSRLYHSVKKMACNTLQIGDCGRREGCAAWWGSCEPPLGTELTWQEERETTTSLESSRSDSLLACTSPPPSLSGFTWLEGNNSDYAEHASLIERRSDHPNRRFPQVSISEEILKNQDMIGSFFGITEDLKRDFTKDRYRRISNRLLHWEFRLKDMLATELGESDRIRVQMRLQRLLHVKANLTALKSHLTLQPFQTQEVKPILHDRWCDIVVINAHAPTEEKDDCIKDSFYEELEHTFDQLPSYHMKILLGDFNAKVGREDIFKPTIGKESLHITSNEIGVRERLSVAKRVEQQINIRRFNIPKLKDEETKQHYQVEISNRFAILASSDEVEEELDLIACRKISEIISKLQLNRA